MRTVRVVLCALVLIGLYGCGGGSSNAGGKNPPPPPPTPPALNGNWEIQGISEVTANTSYLIGSSFTTNGTAVTGTLYFLNYSCFANSSNDALPVSVTGTVSPSSSLSLTSTALNEQSLTLSGTVADGQITSGAYSVSGGCGNGEHGTLTGFSVPSYSGTYTGEIVSNGVSWGNMTLNLTQTATPDSNGLYDLSGTASVANSGLWIWADNPANLANGLASGGYIQGTVLTGNGAINFDGVITNATGDTINCTFSVVGGSLDPSSGTFTLTRSE
jgi:hypothetical protein